MSRRKLLAATAAALVLAACSTTPADPGAKRREIDAKVDNALAELFRSEGTRQLVDRAEAVLVIPDVVSAGFIVGGTYGQGALRRKNETIGYYSVSAASVGLLAGAQSRTMYMLFMTPAALARFQASDGWTVGTDASVAVIQVGGGVRADTINASNQVIALVRDSTGFMANLSLDGTKFNRLAL